MNYLYVIIAVLTFLAVRNIIAVRRLAKAYAEGVSMDRTPRSNTTTHKNPQ